VERLLSPDSQNSATRSKIDAAIVYDCLFAAECLATGLATDPGICVTALVQAGHTRVLELDHLPDIFVIYLTSPWPAPVQIMTEIRDQTPAAKVLLLGVPHDESSILDCIRAGACGWLHKSASLHEVCSSLADINEGKIIYPPSLTYRMFCRLYELASTSALTTSNAAPLSAREVQVMELLGQNKSNQEIAASLHISVHTVKKHVHNLLAKLQIRHRDELSTDPIH
jgi:DNA-binding NarL/FixJ family response regulator